MVINLGLARNGSHEGWPFFFWGEKVGCSEYFEDERRALAKETEKGKQLKDDKT